MWPWMKTASIPTDEPICAGPAEVARMKLMDVDPAFMECFRGERYGYSSKTRVKVVKLLTLKYLTHG